MIAAIVLAAGESKRMGEPKMALPWGSTTVLGQVLVTFANAGVDEIVVVTGAHRGVVEGIVDEARVSLPVRSVFNAEFAQRGMLSSVQCGVRSLTGKAYGATLIGLGDQPQVKERSVRRVVEAAGGESPLVVPSFQQRRGHPWLVKGGLWQSILELSAPQTLRDFLNLHQADICYVATDDDGVLSDLDTPEAYRKFQP